MTDLRELPKLRLDAATRAVELLAERYPWIDTQGLDGDDFEIVAREVLHAAFPSERAWTPTEPKGSSDG